MICVMIGVNSGYKVIIQQTNLRAARHQKTPQQTRLLGRHESLSCTVSQKKIIFWAIQVVLSLTILDVLSLVLGNRILVQSPLCWRQL